MQTVQLDIKDEKLELFLTIVKNLKDDIIENIKVKNNLLDVEQIDKDEVDFKELQSIKEQNNKKYSLEETKKILGL